MNTQKLKAIWLKMMAAAFAASAMAIGAQGSGLYPNGGISVDLVKKENALGGVQLWKDGPYWAECNVGATKPEEYGYYFWWGDTVGYTNNGSAWISVKDGTSIVFKNQSPANSTYRKDNAALISEGYIDSTTSNLVAKCDAATAHLGGPWRVPTDAEFANLTNKCSWTWTSDWNGTDVKGYVVTGKEVGYTDKSIFLPAAGDGSGSCLSNPGSDGGYWSSAPDSDFSYLAWSISFPSGDFGRYCRDRYLGQSVRPLRGFAQ